MSARDELAAAVAELGALPMPTGDTGPAPMTAERLIEIRLREEAATPGPWEEYRPYGESFYAFLGGSHLRGVGTLEFGDGEDADADRAFTLHARQDVPALLAEVDRLRAENRRWRERTEEAELGEAQLKGRLRGLRARVAELEALTPAPIQTCRSCGAGYDYGQPCSVCEFKKRMAAEIADTPAPRDVRPGAEAARRMLRGRALLDAKAAEEAEAAHWKRLGINPPASPEDPHDSPLHHTYAEGRDLPEVTP